MALLVAVFYRSFLRLNGGQGFTVVPGNATEVADADAPVEVHIPDEAQGAGYLHAADGGGLLAVQVVHLDTRALSLLATMNQGQAPVPARAFSTGDWTICRG